MNTETGKKIQEIQLLEQNLQGLTLQKQAVQVELNEISNALSELEKTQSEVYKILGGVMLKATKESLVKELSEKKKVLELRIQAVERQEKILDDKSRKLRDEFTAAAREHKKK